MKLCIKATNQSLEKTLKKVSSLLLQAEIVDPKAAEVIVTDNMKTLEELYSEDKRFVFLIRPHESLATGMPANVRTLPIAFELPNYVKALIGKEKKSVLIFNVHYSPVYKSIYRENFPQVEDEADIKVVKGFSEFQDVALNRSWNLVITDPFPDEATFRKEDGDLVNALIRDIKRIRPDTIVLVEECEGYEHRALEAGADAVIPSFYGEAIVKAVRKYLLKGGERKCQSAFTYPNC